MRQTVNAVALAVLLLLAGCMGGLDTADPETRETTTLTETPTSPTTSIVTPDSTTIDSSRVVDFASLTGQQQSAFRDALRDEASFVPNSSYVNESSGYDFEHITPFQDHAYVRYGGELYQIQLDPGELYASYLIEAVAGSPDDDETVIEFDSLPTEIQDEVRTAITDGEYYAPVGKWDVLPESLQDADYVHYGNETYEMSRLVGDAWAEDLTVEKAE